jgi:hypothetical protein
MNSRAEGSTLGTIIVVITIMMGIIIASIVFFAFATGTNNMQTASKSFTATGANSTAFFITLDVRPAISSQNWNISIYNSLIGVTYYATSSNYTYVTANNTITLNTEFFRWGNSSGVISYDTNAKGSVNQVIVYAVIVFGMVVLVPLIIVGGVMLRSLGFLGGGKGGKV